MKFYRNAVILVIIVALLTGAYFLVRNNKVNQQDVQTKQYEKLSDYLSTDLESVTLENKSGTFVIVKKDGDWALSVPSDLRYDSSVLSSIVVNSASIIADKVVEESAEDFSIYGLDDPAVATIKAKDGTSVTVEIGNQTPTGGGYYAKLKDRSKVCVISKYTGDKLLSGRNDIRTKQLFDMKTDDIKKFGLNKKDGMSSFPRRQTINGTWSHLSRGHE